MVIIVHAVHVVDLITTLPIINDTSVVSTKTSDITGHGCVSKVSIIISFAVSRVGCSVGIRSFTLVTSFLFILNVSIVSSWPSSVASISSKTINAVSVSTIDKELFGQVIDGSGTVLDVEARFN